MGGGRVSNTSLWERFMLKTAWIQGCALQRGKASEKRKNPPKGV
jgi:hypothetical protein